MQHTDISLHFSRCPGLSWCRLGQVAAGPSLHLPAAVAATPTFRSADQRRSPAVRCFSSADRQPVTAASPARKHAAGTVPYVSNSGYSNKNQSDVSFPKILVSDHNRPAASENARPFSNATKERNLNCCK
jgi:hypothetical protein